ncbi:MAG: hypothetical protein WDN72_04525 [Alphaproteobacteria bacterium]
MFRFSFTGLLVLVAVLYFTGAGKWLWEKLHTVDQQCLDISERLGATTAGATVCQALGDGVRALDNGVAQLNERFGERMGNLRAHMPGVFGSLDYNSFGARLENSLSNGTSQLAQWASPSAFSGGLMQPESAPSGAGVRQRLQASLDNFVVGQRFMQSNSVAQALPWLQQGAAQPGYGVLSQLSLGNIYQQGGDGVGADPGTAASYYEAAQNSITALMQSDTPEARQMLRNLPASPQVMQQQLARTIAQLKQQAAGQ